MKLTSSLAFAIAAAAGSYAKNCGPSTECIQFYEVVGCQGQLGEYVPTHGGNCFVFSAFTSLQISGQVFGGVINCSMYSDTNHQNEISHVSNNGAGISSVCGNVPLDGNGLPIQFAQSMICID